MTMVIGLVLQVEEAVATWGPHGDPCFKSTAASEETTRQIEALDRRESPYRAALEELTFERISLQ